MSDKITLKLDSRTITGRKVSQLRRQGILPANIYGKDVKSLAVQLPTKDFLTAFKQAGETNIIYLSVAKETKPRPVLVHNLHLDPVTDQPLHADFHQVDLTKEVTVDIPIDLTGEAPAESKGAVIVQVLHEIEVQALPTNLPEKFTVDISKLAEIGHSISLKDLKLPEKVKLTTDNLDELIVKAEEPAKEEEKPAAPVEGEEQPDEAGEQPAKEAEAKPEAGEQKPDEEKKPDSKPGDSAAKPTKESKPEPKADQTEKKK